MKETARYAAPDGEALHPGDRIGLEPPGCLKRDDGLDAWLTALRHEMARACELPAKAMLGDDFPHALPPDGGGLGPWRWLGVDALKIKNPEVMILGKDGRKMLNVKGIDKKELLAALFNAAQKPTEETVGAVYDGGISPERAGLILYRLTGGNLKEGVYIKKMYGRNIYMEFRCGMTQIDCTMYDAHNGYGKAAAVVESMRREIAANKNAERKAERAKRHRVAVYWQDGSERMDVVANGEPGQCLNAVAALLGVLLVRMQKDKRDRALRRVQRDAAALAEKYEEEGNADD